MIRINLLPVPKARKQERLIIELAVAAASIVAVIAACLFVTGQKEKAIDVVSAENQQINQDINRLKAKVGEVERYKQKLKTLKDQLGVIQSLQAGRAGPVRMMDELTDLMPRKLWITSFRENNKNLTVDGFGDSGPVIADFLESLKTAQYFSDVELKNVVSATEDGVELHKFQITARVKYSL